MSSQRPSLGRIGPTSMRLIVGLVLVLVLFAVATAVALVAQHQAGGSQEKVAQLDHAKEAGHAAAALVREQYMHQAHMIISGDTSHLAHYDETVEITRKATARLLARMSNERERLLAQELVRLARASDAVFQRVMRDVLRGDRSQIKRQHEELETLVGRVVTINDRLNAMLEERSERARKTTSRLRARARLALVGCFAIAMLLAALLSVWVVRSITGPLAQLRRGVARVGRGDLATRMDVARDDEFGELASAFNQMTEDLARNQELVVRSERLASIGQLAAGVAHEINNPLGVILGYAKLLQRDRPRDDKQDTSFFDGIQIIEEEALQCQAIVQSLLDLARKPRLDVAELDLVSLVSETLSRLRDLGKLDGLDTSLSPERAVFVRGDDVGLRQVVRNLVINAAEATEEGGRLELRIARKSERVALEIADTGSGINNDARAKIFDPFFTTKPNGVGLGLAVAHSIVDAHGGHIDIVGRTEGGTRATVWLPALEPLAKTERA